MPIERKIPCVPLKITVTVDPSNREASERLLESLYEELTGLLGHLQWEWYNVEHGTGSLEIDAGVWHEYWETDPREDENVPPQ